MCRVCLASFQGIRLLDLMQLASEMLTIAARERDVDDTGGRHVGHQSVQRTTLQTFRSAELLRDFFRDFCRVFRSLCIPFDPLAFVAENERANSRDQDTALFTRLSRMLDWRSQQDSNLQPAE